MKFKTFIISVLAALVLVLPAVAGNLPAPNSGSIALAVDSPVPAYQEEIELVGTWPGHLNNPRVYVACYQNDVLVYGEATGDGGYGNFHEDGFYVTLGGGYSQWVANGGGEADCVATLFYFKIAGSKNREWNGSGQQEYVELAQVAFHAEE